MNGMLRKAKIITCESYAGFSSRFKAFIGHIACYFSGFRYILPLSEDLSDAFNEELGESSEIKY